MRSKTRSGSSDWFTSSATSHSARASRAEREAAARMPDESGEPMRIVADAPGVGVMCTDTAAL